jgi:hypothetical protein
MGGLGGGSRVQLVKKVGTIECRKEKISRDLQLTENNIISPICLTIKIDNDSRPTKDLL